MSGIIEQTTTTDCNGWTRSSPGTIGFITVRLLRLPNDPSRHPTSPQIYAEPLQYVDGHEQMVIKRAQVEERGQIDDDLLTQAGQLQIANPFILTR